MTGQRLVNVDAGGGDGNGSMRVDGRPFGRYVLLDDLGRGGMAVVSRARMAGPKGFARTVVIKRILAELAEQTSFVDMLATEARLSALLRHRAIVQVYEFGQVEGEYYLAMEFVDGLDLLDLLRACAVRKLRLPVPVACQIVAEIASALAYAHALTDDEGRPLEIVHRDVSPSNIMVTPAGEVKLLDFGIAKAASCVRDDHTVTGTLKGKISYLSPEQADGMPVDRRSDIFSLGIVFHECLTMQRLFRGGSDFETMRLIRESNVAPPSSIAPGIPAELDAVVLKMLMREPRDRFENCDQVTEAITPILRAMQADAAAVRGFLRRLGPMTRRGVTARSTSVPPVAAASASEAEPRLTRQLGPRSRRRWSVVIISALTTLALAGWWLSRESHAPPPSAARPAQLQPAPAPAPPTVVTRPAAVPTPHPAAATPARRPEPLATPLHVTPALPERVRLVIAGPSGAEVLLDNKLVGTIPVDLWLRRASGQRQLKVQAPNTRPWTRAVAADVDVSLKVTLPRLRAEAPARKKSQAQSQSQSQSMGVIKDPFGSP